MQERSDDKTPMERPGFLPSAWRNAWLLGFFLVVVTFIAYQPVWRAGFIWDDDEFLTDNPVIKSADGLYRLWFTASTPDYYPMTFSMLWLEWRLWANNPLGYHLVNVLLHALSAVLLWRVLLRLEIPGALLAAAIFALHPVNVESAAWISEGKNTLCMFFYAGTLLCWLRFEDSGRRGWYGLALAAFALALFSKSAVAPLPLVLLGIAWWRRGRVAWKDLWRVALFFVVTGAVCCVTVWFHLHRAIGPEVIRTDSFWSRLAGAGWAVWFYLYKAMVPVNLIFVYPRWQIDAGNVLSYIPLVLLAAAFVLFWHWRQRWGKGLFFGLAYFVVMLLPVLGFLNIYYMRYSLVADHWQYFAIVGPIVLAAAIIRRPLVAAALLVVLGTLTWQQCGMYASIETLWKTTLRRNPGSWLAEGDLGKVCLQEGRVNEAIVHFQKALELNPIAPVTYYNLGVCFFKLGQFDEAIARYEKALRLSSTYALARNDLGLAFRREGRMDEAITQYQTVLQTDPDNAEAHFNLANTLMQMGKVDEAIPEYQMTLKIIPDDASVHFNLAIALLRENRAEEAIVQYQQALKLSPTDPTFQGGLAWLLATCSKASLRNGSEAVELARRANESTGGENPIILHTLAAAYAEAGQFSEAVETARHALRLAEAQSNPGLAAAIQSEMKFYQAGKAIP
jgi:tetratricopeptide (TPR) repeat protein